MSRKANSARTIADRARREGQRRARLRRLLDYAREHDVACMECGYNLRGLDCDRCPECGRMLNPALYILPEPSRSEEEELRRLRAFLAERDVPCPRCGTNLRGLARRECPACGLELSEWRLRPRGIGARQAWLILVAFAAVVVAVAVGLLLLTVL